MSGVFLDILRWVLTTLHSLGWSLIYSLWIGAGLGMALWILLRLLGDRSAWARYALCCAAIVLLTGVTAQTYLSVRSAYAGHPQLVDRYAAQLMAEGAPNPVGDLPGGWTAADLTLAVETLHDHGLSPWVDGPTAYRIGSVLALVATVWLFVALGRLLELGRALGSLRRLRTRGVSPADERWLRLLAELRARLDVWHPVTIAVSRHVDSPILIGWWRPVILLPPTPHAELDDAEAEAVLAHELAHIRRGDYAVNLVQSVAEALLFFNPAMWWLGEKTRDEREYCSDDLAQRTIKGTVADYLRALATLEALRGRGAPGPAVAANGRSLLLRIRRLAELSTMPRRPRVDVDLLLVVVCLVAMWIPTLGAARSVERPTVAIMKHEMRLPRDFERVARDVGIELRTVMEVSHD